MTGGGSDGGDGSDGGGGSCGDAGGDGRGNDSGGCLLSRILCSQLSFVSFQGLALVDCLSRRPSTLSVP